MELFGNCFLPKKTMIGTLPNPTVMIATATKEDRTQRGLVLYRRGL